MSLAVYDQGLYDFYHMSVVCENHSRNWSKLWSKSHRPNNIADVRKLTRNVGSDLGTKSSSPKDEVEVVQSIVESFSSEKESNGPFNNLRQISGKNFFLN